MNPIFRAMTRHRARQPMLVLGLLLAALTAAPAQSLQYVETFTNGPAVGPVPEGNPVGAVFSGTVSDVPAGLTVGTLTLELNLSGGFNGNLYAYLESPNGTQVVLMDRPGVSVADPFGATGPGMNITLQNTGAANGSIQDETSDAVLSGSYTPAGSLADLGGAPVDGTWQLFFTDLVAGGGTTTVDSWALTVSVVPEPKPASLLILAAILLAWRGQARRKPSTQPTQKPGHQGKRRDQH